MIAVRKRLVNGTAAWLIPTLIACGFVAASVIKNLPGTTGDTVGLVHGVRTMVYCLDHGISHCNHVVISGAGVGPYALFQYLPALLLNRLGLSDHAVYSGLTLISLFSFYGMIGLGTWTVAKTGRRWAPPFVALLLLTSPLMWYAGETFGESLAAFLFSLLAVASLRRWPPALIALCAFLACITKDTVFPIAALLAAAALWATPIASRRLRRAHWYGLGCGIALGLIATAAFNWFRYHQVTNSDYFQSFYQVPGVGRRLGLSAALWVAPNGGLAIFWPLAALSIIVALWAVVTQLRDRTRIRQALPGVAIIVSVVFVTGELASWWSPFGWGAWGPRLTLPTIPATLFIVIVLYRRQLESLFRRLLGTTMRAGLFTAGVVAISLPQVNILNARDVEFRLFAPDAICPSLPSPKDQEALYYRCLNHWAWGRHWILLDTWRAVSHAPGAVFAAAFVLVWVALILVMRASFTTRRSVSPSTG